jgi:hypothetical protein
LVKTIGTSGIGHPDLLGVPTAVAADPEHPRPSRARRAQLLQVERGAAREVSAARPVRERCPTREQRGRVGGEPAPTGHLDIEAAAVPREQARLAG